MYKYFNGRYILSEEKMLTADEIALKYGFYESTEYHYPNGILVEAFIDDYISNSGYKTTQYLYIDEETGLSKKVYPNNLIESSVRWFKKWLEHKEYYSSDIDVRHYKDYEFIYSIPASHKESQNMPDNVIKFTKKGD